MNKWTIIGNLTRDPETRTTQSGTNVCTFTVAVNNPRDKDKAIFVRVSTFGKTAENCQSYLAKGRKVCCVGECRLNEYTGQDGANHANLEMSCQEVEFLTAKSEGQTAAPAQRQAPSMAPTTAQGYMEVDDGELPF